MCKSIKMKTKEKAKKTCDGYQKFFTYNIINYKVPKDIVCVYKNIWYLILMIYRHLVNNSIHFYRIIISITIKYYSVNRLEN